MDISLQCSQCGQAVIMKESGPGTSVNCPKCGNLMAVRVAPAAPGHKRTVHPSIVASLYCLGVLALLLGLQVFLIRQNPAVAVLPVFAALPFQVAALLCLIYGLCQGNIKSGLLLLGGLALMLALSCGIQFGAILAASTAQSPQIEQLQQLQKQLEQMLHQ